MNNVIHERMMITMKVIMGYFDMLNHMFMLLRLLSVTTPPGRGGDQALQPLFKIIN